MRTRRPGMPWLIPVRLDDCQIPALDIGGGQTLESLQRVDLFGERREEEMSRLVGAVLRILGMEAQGAAPVSGQIDERDSPPLNLSRARDRVPAIPASATPARLIPFADPDPGRSHLRGASAVAVESQPTEQVSPVIGSDGLFLVGPDVRPGVYRTSGPASARRDGYIALLGSTSTQDIIDNVIVSGPVTVTIGPGVKAVQVQACQPWHWINTDLGTAIQPAAAPEPTSRTTSPTSSQASSADRTPATGGSRTTGAAEAVIGGDGTFVVGIDIRPGVYRTGGPSGTRAGMCLLLSSTSNKDIVTLNRVAGPVTITLGPSIKAVEVSGCQPWHWAGPDLDTVRS